MDPVVQEISLPQAVMVQRGSLKENKFTLIVYFYNFTSSNYQILNKNWSLDQISSKSIQ